MLVCKGRPNQALQAAQLIQHNVFLAAREAGSLRSSCWQGWFLWGPSPWGVDAAFSLCPHMVFALCVSVSSSPKDTNHIELGSTPSHFNLITYVKNLSPKTATFCHTGDLDGFCGDIIHPITNTHFPARWLLVTAGYLLPLLTWRRGNDSLLPAWSVTPPL